MRADYKENMEKVYGKMIWQSADNKKMILSPQTSFLCINGIFGKNPYCFYCNIKILPMSVDHLDFLYL